MRRSVLSCGELWSVTAVACKQPSQTRAPLSPIGTGYALPPAAPRRSATTAYQSWNRSSGPWALGPGPYALGPALLSSQP